MDNSGLSTAMGFTSKELVDITVGCVSAKVYPKITQSMPPFECAHAYQVTKTALKNLPTNLCLIFDAFGAQLNGSLMVKGIISGWHCHFDSHWNNFKNLSILSFHNSAGAIINNTVTITKAQIFHPIINGPRNQSRAGDVRYVHLQCMLNFAPILTLIPYPTLPILRVLYYLELPQNTQAMVNDNNVNYNLTSYFRPADLRAMTPNNIRTVILDASLQMGPVVLKASDFNLAQANTDSTKIARSIKTKILKLVWPQICSSVLGEICPRYSDQPQAVLEHIRLTFTIMEGNVIMTPSLHTTSAS
jgi:hypothetical protein